MAQVADTEMATQRVSIGIRDFGNNEAVNMVQESTNPPVTVQYADGLPISGEDEMFLDDKIRLKISHSDVQKMVDFAMLWYEETTFGRFSEGCSRNTMGNLLNTLAKELQTGLLVLTTEL